MQQKGKKDEEKNLIKKIKRPKLIITQKSKKMTLKELQKMIKEEMSSYTNEANSLDSTHRDQYSNDSASQKAFRRKYGYSAEGVEEAEDDVDVSVSDADVDVDEEQGDEDILRNIYDMLKDKFEGEEEAGDDMDDMDDMGDVEGEEAEDSDLDEWTGKNDPKPGGKGTTGYDAKVGGKGSTGYDASSKALQERFQKLANIIK